MTEKLTSTHRAAQLWCLPEFGDKVMDGKFCEAIAGAIDAGIMDSTTELRDLLETAWAIMCNAGEGDWSRETKGWKAAAEKWRDRYHQTLRKPAQEEPKNPVAPRDILKS